MTMTIHDLLDSPPCPRCAGETCPADEAPERFAPEGPPALAVGVRWCYVCAALFTPRRAVIAGPAGHWWAYSERFGVLFCKPQSRGESNEEPPPHPDALPGDTFADQEWGESEVIPPATVHALLLLVGRDPSSTVAVRP